MEDFRCPALPAEFRDMLISQTKVETQLAEILRRIEKIEKQEEKSDSVFEIKVKEVETKIGDLQKWMNMSVGALGIISLLSPVLFKKLGL